MNYRFRFTLMITVFASFTAGCSDANSETSVAKKMLKPVIKNQCAQELDQSKLWKVSTYLMSTSNKQQLAQDVCECVAENALTDISSKDLLRAMLDEEVKKQLTQKAVLNSVKACILESKE